VKIAAASAGLKASFMAVPALDKPRSLRELTYIARDEHAAEASREGLQTAIVKSPDTSVL
jgi:hypothetical protein